MLRWSTIAHRGGGGGGGCMSPPPHKAQKTLKKVLVLETLFLSFYPCRNGTRMSNVHRSIFRRTARNVVTPLEMQFLSLDTCKSTTEWYQVKCEGVARMVLGHPQDVTIFGIVCYYRKLPKIRPPLFAHYF